jgi:predicted DNA-binding ribbon-helix-helix protein
MCEIFISAEPQSYESRTRSVRLHGLVTSIRLQNLFWQVLGEIAQRDGTQVAQLIERLYDELVAARGEIGNFASFLRVSALRYEALLARGRIPADPAVSIRSLDAQAVLHALPPGWGAGAGSVRRAAPLAS